MEALPTKDPVAFGLSGTDRFGENPIIESTNFFDEFRIENSAFLPQTHRLSPSNRRSHRAGSGRRSSSVVVVRALQLGGIDSCLNLSTLTHAP